MSYVDGFVVPVPRKNLAAYRRMAQKAGKVWKEYGALEYKEWISDDVQIAFNLIPQVDTFMEDGFTREEWKIVTETRKILHLPDLPVSCTAVRVPVRISHSEAVHVETEMPIDPDTARALLMALKQRDDPGGFSCLPIDEYFRQATPVPTELPV